MPQRSRRSRSNAELQHLIDLTQFAGPALAGSTLGQYESSLPAQLQTYPDQAYDGPYYRNVDPLSNIQNVHVPTFIVGGEYDLFQRGEPLLTGASALPSSQKKLLYGPWYHGNPSTDLTADDGSAPVHDANGNTHPLHEQSLASLVRPLAQGRQQRRRPVPDRRDVPARFSTSGTPTRRFPYAAEKYQPWYLGASPSGSGATEPVRRLAGDIPRRLRVGVGSLATADRRVLAVHSAMDGGSCRAGQLCRRTTAAPS